MLKNLVLVTLTLIFLQSKGQDVCIPWTPTYKLKWTDFQGHKIDSINGLAATCASIEVKTKYYGDSLAFDITNNFLSNVSFVDASAFKQFGDSLPDLLNHEQLHFDIAEYHTRLMRKKLYELSLSDTLNVDNCKLIVDSVYELRNKMDSLYDYQTFHSVIKSEQQKWQLKVRELLMTLNDFYESNEITPHNKR